MISIWGYMSLGRRDEDNDMQQLEGESRTGPVHSFHVLNESYQNQVLE